MIRPYHPTDYAILLEMWRLNTPTYFGPEEEPHFVEFLTTHTTPFYVIEQSGSVVGCAGYRYEEATHTGQVSWFVFHPRVQGQGLGRQMLHYCLDRLREFPDLQKIIVRTSQMAAGFFAKSGFVTVYIEKDHWAPGFDLYLMEHQKTT
jgi:N-acetylglutamate synthase-like GNAT family acetyltransferase